MKRIGYLYDKICDCNNIRTAIYKSSRGKTKRHDVIRVLDNVDCYVNKIHYLLINKLYFPSDFKVSKIYDSLNKKERIISKPKYFPDQIIQYCLMNILEPILLKRFYNYSCGCIVGKRTSYGQKYIERIIRNDIKGTKYCLKMDIRKFYPSINKDILKNKFSRIIKDFDALSLIYRIIDSDCDGIPLGNYTSGFFANFYLNDFDFFLKEILGVKYYIRYIDDLIILCSNKKRLHYILNEVINYLSYEKLVLNKNYQIFNINYRDLDFLGFRFYHNKTILRKRNMIRISRRTRNIYKNGDVNFKDACAMVSYFG